MNDGGHRPARLLVIDDEPIVGMRLAQVFTKAGMDVSAHVDPRLALDEAARRPFDLVITDLGMPGMDGLEVLRRIRAASPATPVIVITAHAGGAAAAEALGLGAFALMAKPFRVEEIRDAVARALAAAPSRS